jgi:hypothetical protein
MVEPLFVSLLNLGGVGILAGLLLILHWNAVKEFRQDQTEQRDLTLKIWTQIIGTLQQEHRAMLEQMTGLGEHVLEVKAILGERQR